MGRCTHAMMNPYREAPSWMVKDHFLELSDKTKCIKTREAFIMMNSLLIPLALEIKSKRSNQRFQSHWKPKQGKLQKEGQYKGLNWELCDSLHSMPRIKSVESDLIAFGYLIKKDKKLKI